MVVLCYWMSGDVSRVLTVGFQGVAVGDCCWSLVVGYRLSGVSCWLSVSTVAHFSLVGAQFCSHPIPYFPTLCKIAYFLLCTLHMSSLINAFISCSVKCIFLFLFMRFFPLSFVEACFPYYNIMHILRSNESYTCTKAFGLKGPSGQIGWDQPIFCVFEP